MRSILAALAALTLACAYPPAADAQLYQTPCCTVPSKSTKDSSVAYGKVSMDSIRVTGKKASGWGRFTLDSLVKPRIVIKYDTVYKTVYDTVKVYDTVRVTLSSVVVTPSAASLAPGGTATFSAKGILSNGSAATGLTFAWSATGGAISSGGVYLAGQTAGTFRVIATAGGKADTSVVVVSAPPPTTVGGVPFGATQVWNDLGTAATEGINLAQDPVTPDVILTRIATARQFAKKMVINLPGGSHDKFMSTINGVYQFDHAKWTMYLQQYNRADIKDAVAKGVADGVILGANYLDEPHVTGQGDGNTWGPFGTFTKVRVDSLCAEGKALFPTLPAGVTHQHQLFDVTHQYRTCEFLIDQYQYSFGSVTAWRDAGIAMAQREGLVILFGANWLGGGIKDANAVKSSAGVWSGWDCANEGGYLGQYAPLCQMTPAQVDATARALGPYGCGFRGWRWDDVDLRDYQPTLKNVSAWLATQSGRSCDARP